MSIVYRGKVYGEVGGLLAHVESERDAAIEDRDRVAEDALKENSKLADELTDALNQADQAEEDLATAKRHVEEARKTRVVDLDTIRKLGDLRVQYLRDEIKMRKATIERDKVIADQKAEIERLKTQRKGWTG